MKISPPVDSESSIDYDGCMDSDGAGPDDDPYDRLDYIQAVSQCLTHRGLTNHTILCC